MLDIRTIVVFFLLLVPLASVGEQNVLQLGDETISYSDIKIPMKDVEFLVRAKKGKEYLSTLTEEDLESIKHQYELLRLYKAVRSVVYKKEIQERAIEVSDEEVGQAWRKLSSNTNNSEKLEAIEYYKRLLSALELVNEGFDASVVYQKYLSDLISSREWEVHRKYFSDDSRIEMIESELEKLERGNIKPDEGFKAYLADKKLSRIIDQELRKSNPEYRRFKALLESGKGGKEAIRYIQSAESRWWSKRIESYDIEVLDQRFGDIKSILSIEPSSYRNKLSVLENDGTTSSEENSSEKSGVGEVSKRVVNDKKFRGGLEENWEMYLVITVVFIVGALGLFFLFLKHKSKSQ